MPFWMKCLSFLGIQYPSDPDCVWDPEGSAGGQEGKSLHQVWRSQWDHFNTILVPMLAPVSSQNVEWLVFNLLICPSLVFNTWQMNPYDRSTAFGEGWKPPGTVTIKIIQTCFIASSVFCSPSPFVSTWQRSVRMDCAARAGSLKSGTAVALQKASPKVCASRI